MPVVTGIPTTSIKDLNKEYPNRESLEKLTDAELLRLAAREAAMAVGIIARTIQARAVSLVSTKQVGWLICSNRWHPLSMLSAARSCRR